MTSKELPDDAIKVLDKGYVRLLFAAGDDLSSVNAARASFMKETHEVTDKDQSLLNYLTRKSELSPFRHCFLSFEVYAPLMVARQWFKYQVGSNHGEYTAGWNEASFRYLTIEPEFYLPDYNQWRCAPENKKQGSGDPVDELTGKILKHSMEVTIEQGLEMYNYALEQNVAPELARGFLPAYFMYTCWRWSASLAAVAHFLRERLGEGAQNEIYQYATVVKDLVHPHFPASLDALLK